MIARLVVLLHRLLGRSDIYFGESLYMRRWRIGPKKWLGVRLHHIVRGDGDRELHDHPFSFLSIILRGGYVKHTLDGRARRYGPGSFVFRSAEALHRLELDRPAWTLVIRGPFRRDWGFLTDRGWISWQQHVAARRDSVEAIGAPPADNPFVAGSSV